MFNFTFSVRSGVFNPFAAQSEERERQQQAIAPQTITRKLPPPPRRHIPPASINEVSSLSRKRGWEPSSSSPSAPVSQRTETNGWLDTPSRYVEAASQSQQSTRVDTEFDAELPPTKRRRTLADSIISTALSAALIGTTVGMTAYRMWRDRGKSTTTDPELVEQPPPPYQEKEEWVDMTQPKPATSAVRSPRISRKLRSVAKRTPRRRAAPIAMSPARTPLCMPSPSVSIPVERDEITPSGGEDIDDQMDWMNDKIRQLIEEGQKALGKEIVVMSDDAGDEDGAVDDGSDGWEEVDDRRTEARPSSPMSSNFRRKKARHVPSISPPARNGNAFPASYLERSLSPAPRSPGFRRTKHPRLGQPQENAEDIKVLYEPSVSDHKVIGRSEDLDDDDTRSLSERMEKIRQAYCIQ